MVLYAADLDDLAPPKKVGRKQKKEKPVEEQSVEQPQEEKVEKKKRVLTEKQKEALQKGQETRRLKREQAEREKAEAEELQKKLLEAAPKKRKAKKDVSIAEPEPVPEPVAEPVAEPVKEKKKRVKKPVLEIENTPESNVLEVPPKKKRKSSQEPPEWFKKYVETVQKEKAAGEGAVSKKQEKIIKDEAIKVAKKSWESGYTRDRVQNEVDNHSITYLTSESYVQYDFWSRLIVCFINKCLNLKSNLFQCLWVSIILILQATFFLVTSLVWVSSLQREVERQQSLLISSSFTRDTFTQY